MYTQLSSVRHTHSHIFIVMVVKKAYEFLHYISYFMYLTVLMGLSVFSPFYMNIVELLIKLYVAGYLLFLFNPFRSKTQITPHERKLIFDAAIYLLITVVPYKSILGLK